MRYRLASALARLLTSNKSTVTRRGVRLASRYSRIAMAACSVDAPQLVPISRTERGLKMANQVVDRVAASGVRSVRPRRVLEDFIYRCLRALPAVVRVCGAKHVGQ